MLRKTAAASLLTVAGIAASMRPQRNAAENARSRAGLGRGTDSFNEAAA